MGTGGFLGLFDDVLDEEFSGLSGKGLARKSGGTVPGWNDNRGNGGHGGDHVKKPRLGTGLVYPRRGGNAKEQLPVVGGQLSESS